MRRTSTLSHFVFPMLSLHAFRASGVAEPFIERKPVFVAGHDNVVEYRIPGIVTTSCGTLVAVCDARVERPGDAINNIDLVMKRSFNQGRTWEPMRVLVDFPGQEAAADPCILFDREKEAIWVFYDHVLAEPARSGQRKREERDVTLQAICSTDNGATWLKPVDINPKVAGPAWEALMAGPGRGTQTRDGRLLVPCYTRRPEDDYAQVLASDDHGQSWRLTAAPGPDTNEAAVVELTDGRWMLNMRCSRGKGCRGVATTNDGGDSWSPLLDDAGLPDSQCQGTLIRYTDVRDGGERNRLLFANAAHQSKRQRMTVRVSYDEGETWPVAKVIHDGPAAYCCLTIMNDGTIGLLYEHGDESHYERIGFARFNLEWLTDGMDQLERREQ